MAREFDGTNDNVDFGDINPFTSTDISFSMWVYLDNFDSDMILIAKMNRGSNSLRSFNLRVRGTNESLQFFTHDGTNQNFHESNNNTISSGVWTHVVCTYDDSADSCDFYVDGSLLGKQKTSTLPEIQDTTTSITFGMTEDTGSVDDLDGRLAEAGIWLREITTGEINSLADGYAPNFFMNNLLFYSPLSGRYASEIDLIGGNTGSITGATYVEHPRIIYPNYQSLSPLQITQPIAASRRMISYI